jgi:hypothetical protein
MLSFVLDNYLGMDWLNYKTDECNFLKETVKLFSVLVVPIYIFTLVEKSMRVLIANTWSEVFFFSFPFPYLPFLSFLSFETWSHYVVPRLAWNLPSSSLTLLSAVIIGVCHNTWLVGIFSFCHSSMCIELSCDFDVHLPND